MRWNTRAIQTLKKVIPAFLILITVNIIFKDHSLLSKCSAQSRLCFFFFILHQVGSHRLYNKDFNRALNININFFIFFFYFFVTLFIAFFIYYNFFSFLSFYLYTLQPCCVTPFVGYVALVHL